MNRGFTEHALANVPVAVGTMFIGWLVYTFSRVKIDFTFVYGRFRPIKELPRHNIFSAACVFFILNEFSENSLRHFARIVYKGNNSSVFYAVGPEY
jgi:hypothetical protein